MSNSKWDRNLILKTLRALHRRGQDLSYNALAVKNQALVSAANYHYKSYKRAVEAAGIDYAEVRRKPKWSKENIAALLRKSRRKGLDLSWRAVTLRNDELSRAASAAVHPHLFGTWNKALAAAGLDPQRVARYHRWDGPAVKKELEDRRKRRRPVNASVIQKEVPGLYRAAVRAFGSYDAALAAAGVDPDSARRRRAWTKPAVLDALRAFHAAHGTLSHGVLRAR
ncbi:MAG TPA: hypothetical protein VK324_07840, partial [Tepidisphaeraceae bacterium]|nr:hypothetical protein [Tepidisphaeraceae bacterium]